MKPTYEGTRLRETTTTLSINCLIQPNQRYDQISRGAAAEEEEERPEKSMLSEMKKRREARQQAGLLVIS